VGETAVRTHDGVAFLARGNAVLIVYQAPARLHRTRWLFDMVDAVATKQEEGIIGLMVVLSTADPPDAPTRAENAARLRKLGPALRALVTVPVGDAIWVSIVRTVMRAMYIILGMSKTQSVMTTLEAGLDRLLKSADQRTPSREQLEADIDALHAALGVQASWAHNRAKPT
jgi:hypothetical protein